METIDSAKLLGHAIRSIDGFMKLDITGTVTNSCDSCNGTGKVPDYSFDGSINVQSGPPPIDCPHCNASGTTQTVINLQVEKKPGVKKDSVSPSKK